MADADIITALPTELLHLMAYELGILTAADIRNLALTSTTVHSALLSTAFDVAQHRATAGASLCIRKGWEDAAVVAVRRQQGVVAATDGWEWEVTSSLVLAARHGMARVVEALLAEGKVDPAESDNYAIREAGACGHAECVRVLLGDTRVDPRADGSSALLEALAGGHVDAAAVVLADPRIDPARDNNHALRWVASTGQPASMALLLADPRVDPTANNNSAIRTAVTTHASADVVAALLADPRLVLTPAVCEALYAAALPSSRLVLASDPRFAPYVVPALP